MTTSAPCERAVLPRLAFLMEYPGAKFHAQVGVLDAAAAGWPLEAVTSLALFAGEAGGRTLDELQELYTRTFDLAPQCVPYVSVQVLGEESNQRTKLMTGLLTIYRQGEFVSGTELPDHLALVLRYAPQFSEEEWQDFRACCLEQALAKMTAALEKAGNPYVHVLRSVQAVLGCAGVAVAEAPVHAA